LSFIMSVHDLPVFAIADRSTTPALSWLGWLAAQAANEMLVAAALTLVGAMWVAQARPGKFSRSVRFVAWILGLLGLVASGAALVAGLRAGPWTGLIVKLAVAGLLFGGSVAIQWRTPRRRRLKPVATNTGDLDRLRLLAAAVAASEDGVMIAEVGREQDPRLRIAFANPAFERMTGYSSHEAVGLSPSVLADDAEPESHDLIRRALRGSEPARLEVPSRRKDGSSMWTEWQVVPVADETGQLTHSIAVLRDTTLRRRAEQAVRESEARFRGLFEQSADAILVIDGNGRIADANRRACHCLGYSPEELARMHMTDLEAGSRFVDIGPGETFTAENWYRRKDGSEFPVEVRYAVLESAGQRLKLALVRDVTRRRTAEQTLREREELLRNIIANIPCGVFWKDRNSIYLGCNDQVAKDHGLDGPNQVIGRTDYELCVSQSDATFYRDCDQRVMQSGEPIVNLEEAQSRPGGILTTLLTSKVPLRDASGEIVGIVGVYQNITERKRLEAQLQQAQKMEAVGRLAGGIAHDFNNLLTIIRGNADLLRSPLPSGTLPADLIDDLRHAADRAAALVRQLLMFSRRQPARPEIVDLNEVVGRLAGLLGRLLGERITVETRLAPGAVTIRVDQSHLEQVVMNLAVNARDAMPDGGILTLGTEVGEGGDSEPCGRVARLTVSDTGVGMTDQVKAQIFEPFFTTKGPDKGTGLGLATVFGIVEQAGGRIRVASAPGAGTKFRIAFPWFDGQPSPVNATPLPLAVPERPLARSASILLVEDEDAVRKLARLTLEGRGYAVTDAPDGESALQLLTSDRHVDILVTDMTMPGIDGRELAGQVRARRPGLGVVFVSGYVPDTGRLTEIPGAIFLPKPFTPSDLLRAVGRVAPRHSRDSDVPVNRFAGSVPSLT
jgi:two-component system, cell cycle sensor histidine kinase and response regulator CckA